MFVKSTTDSSVMCNCIISHCKSRSDLNGDGVLIAILEPPCKTDGVPEKSIILKRTVPTNVQADACESMLLELAYQRASGAKYCLRLIIPACWLIHRGHKLSRRKLATLEDRPQSTHSYSDHPVWGKYKVDERRLLMKQLDLAS